MDTKIVVAIMALVVLGGAYYFGSSWLSRQSEESPQAVTSEVAGETPVEGEEVIVEGSLESVKNTTPLSSSDKVAQMLTGKWRNEASQNQIFKISEDHTFEESYLTANGEFMVPKGIWRLEKTSGASATFDPAAPGAALVFVRVSEAGDERRYEIRTLTDAKVEFFDMSRKTIVTWLRIVPTP